MGEAVRRRACASVKLAIAFLFVIAGVLAGQSSAYGEFQGFLDDDSVGADAEEQINKGEGGDESVATGAGHSEADRGRGDRSSGRTKVVAPPPNPFSGVVSSISALFETEWKDVDRTPYKCTQNGNVGKCVADPKACTAEEMPTIRTAGVDVMIPNTSGVATTRGAGGEGQSQVGTTSLRGAGSPAGTSTSARCVGSKTPEVPQGAQAPGAEDEKPVVITVTQKDFAKLPVEASSAHAGPEQGWLPANMDLVLYADSEAQELETELLDTPVRIRATPVEYRWDLGDGNVLVTDNPGEPWPSKDVSATFAYEGWYDVTLTTTYEGQFSVDGGEWQDIDGTVEIASEPQEIYSKSLESRLVNPDRPHDEERDPFVPKRSADTEGPRDPNATIKEI